MDELDDATSYAGNLLRGDRVSLREVREADCETLTEWWNDPVVQVLQTNWVRPKPEQTIAEMIRGWSANLGVIIGPPHWSAGLGTDALRVLVRYGFPRMAHPHDPGRRLNDELIDLDAWMKH